MLARRLSSPIKASAANVSIKGAARLPALLDAEKPEVVLILEGVNAVWIRSTSAQAENLRSMVTAARDRHVDVILATVMPVTTAMGE